MATMGLKEVETYVFCHKNTVAQYITNCPILEICLVEEQRPVAQVSWRWWDQDYIDLSIGEGRPMYWAMEKDRSYGADREA